MCLLSSSLDAQIFKHFYIFISLPVISIYSGLFPLFFFLLIIYLVLNKSMVKPICDVVVLSVFLQHASLQIPKLSNHVYRALSYSITDALDTVIANVEHLTSRDSSVSLVTWLRYARLKNRYSALTQRSALD